MKRSPLYRGVEGTAALTTTTTTMLLQFPSGWQKISSFASLDFRSFLLLFEMEKVEEGGGKIVYFLDILQHSLFPFLLYRVFNNTTIDFFLFLPLFFGGFMKLNAKIFFNNFFAHVCIVLSDIQS